MPRTAKEKETETEIRTESETVTETKPLYMYNQLTWVIDPSIHPTIHQWRVLVNQVGAIYLKGQSMRDEVGLKLNK